MSAAATRVDAKGSDSASLVLGIAGFSYADLHRPERLAALERSFDAWLAEEDPGAAARLSALRDAARPHGTSALPPKEYSASLVHLAPFVGRFLARLFGVEAEVHDKAALITRDKPVFAFRKHVVKKRLLGGQAAQAWGRGVEEAHRVADALRALSDDANADEEESVAHAALRVHELEDTLRKAARKGGVTLEPKHEASAEALRAALRGVVDTAALDSAALDTAALATMALDALCVSLDARRRDSSDPASRWSSLRARHDVDHHALVQLRPAPAREEHDASAKHEHVGPAASRRERVEPFALTDARMPSRSVSSEIDVCLDCHARDKDSCSKGLRDKSGALKSNAIGVDLPGCPLGEPIGEMNELRREGDILGALVAVTVANPMCPGTGHRICNDCMKACVLQTQEPVNIPEIETRVLDDVLTLPWGFEIWSLLARWNPLRVARSTPRPYLAKNVMVVGLGPAGYTLAHYLLQEGFGVVAIDGLKIEPLPQEWVGSASAPPQPLRDVSALREELDKRVIAGFGGVSEYGITVRWDKSFLTLLHLHLARHTTFRAYGGVRFGGTLTVDDAWELGFDHIAIAAGAGRPTQIRVPNALARGVRQASDFLMALQLTGAFKRDSLTPLTVRLPALVIGGGLTAIDTATELLAYYVVQVEKTLVRVEALGEEAALALLDEEERGIVAEHLAHARAIRAERALAAAQGREPRLQALLDSWGGVRLVYRRRVVDSPAYRLNHEEVQKSLEEGVRYVELLSPSEVHVDAYGAAEAMSFEEQQIDEAGRLSGTGQTVRLPARTILVAAGTKPNVIYEREHPGTFEIDDRSGYFTSHRAEVTPSGTRVSAGEGFFTSYVGPRGQTVSYYGDNHPKYAGSVVKAMASAKDGHTHVAQIFEAQTAHLDARTQPARDAAWGALAAQLDSELLPTVHGVRRLAPGIVEVIVRAPRAAQRFQPGQFYRLQTFERGAERRVDTTLVSEGIALTGAWTDAPHGLVSVIVLELGGSSRLCDRLRPGEPIVLMGPTGMPTEIPRDENVVLLGGGLGNAVLFSIGRALREAGSRVLYFAGYRRGELLFKQDEVEASADKVVWATDGGAHIAARRAQDAHIRANIVEAMHAYTRGELGEKVFELSETNRVLAIGSDGMMAAVKAARHGALADQIGRAQVALGSINSPMQCMMKEVCGQCLQRRVDPVTGKERYVYTCFEQDQPLDEVDFPFLRQRLRQSSAHEKLADAWLTRLLESDEAAE